MNLPETLCEQNITLKDKIKSLLDLGNFEEANDIFKDDNNKDAIIKNSSDIIHLLGQHIKRDTFEDNYNLYQCCVSLMNYVAEVASPDESIFEFIELAEENDELLFSVMLKTMKIPLLKIINIQKHALTWCLSTIIRHIYELPQTEDLKLEGEECTFLENSDQSFKMANLYKEVLDFLEGVLSHVLNNAPNEKDYSEFLKNSLLTFLIKLLGRPLIYMDLEHRKTKCEFRLISERILDNVVTFKLELTHFLNYVSPYKFHKKKTVTDAVDLDFNNLALGVLYYLVFKEKLGLAYISYVYHPIFLLQMTGTLALDMIIVENSRVQNKGLLLLESVLVRVSDASLDLDNINGELFGKLSEVLSNVMIYSNVKENRLIAVIAFKMLLIKFNPKGRYYILYNIQNKVNQPNFIGYIITITKDFVVEMLNNRQSGAVEFFTGKNLCKILEKFCFLHKGAESDLIELSDQIIAALNFIRYLLIKDKENITGVSHFIPKFEKDFLEPLKTGLSLSIAHYKLQKTEVENTPFGGKCDVSVGGVQLPSLSSDQKLSILETALTTFDVIQSLVARVEECLDDYKLAHFVHETT